MVMRGARPDAPAPGSERVAVAESERLGGEHLALFGFAAVERALLRLRGWTADPDS